MNVDKNQKTNKIALRGRIWWLYIKYQVLATIIISAIILPAFNATTSLLIRMSGRAAISSGDYKTFFLSIYGLPVLLVGIAVLFLILGFSINTFVILSSLVEEKKLHLRVRDVLRASLQSVRHFFSPLGIFLVLHIAFIFPIIGLGIKMTPLKNFKIPNFISYVIFTTPLYRILYTIAFITLVIISMVYIFTVHFLLIEKEKPLVALRHSRKLMKKYWRRFLVEYLLKILQIIGIAILGSIAFIFIIRSNRPRIFSLLPK